MNTIQHQCYLLAKRYSTKVLFQSLLDPKNFRKAEAELIGRGLIFVKLKNRDDIQNASKVIKFIQDTQRIKIADLVEIAMRRGLL